MRTLRIIFVWTLVSLLLQSGGYFFLNREVQKVMTPVLKEPITLDLTATIPGSDLQNIQLSYAKDYLAYTENGTFKIFNLKKGKQVFEKKSPSTTDKTMGVCTYQWLPDRNTLVYFYAKKNPNEVTSVTVYPKATVKTPQIKNTEDPNQKIEKVIPVEPRIEKRYGNPQITELYSLELGDSDDETTLPDDRFNQSIDNLPRGGKIENLVFSTSSNMIYLTVKNESTQLLMQIDVMKDVETLNKSGEAIDNIAASDRYGTVYIDSKVGKTSQVVALDGTERRTISKNSDDTILGIRDGKVFIGEVINDELVKIKTTSDRSELKSNPTLETEWEGSIPFKNTRMLISSKGQVIVYNNQTAYIVTTGQLEEIKLQGDENYVSLDGAELIELTQQGTSTVVKLRAIKNKK